VEYQGGWTGNNAPDENQSGGMSRRLVMAWDSESCMELCQEPDLSNGACVTSTERGQISGVPIKDNILLYVSSSETDTQGNDCDMYARPYKNDFVERSGAAGMLHIMETDEFAESGHAWTFGSNVNFPSQIGQLAPKKTLEYHQLNNLPEPLMIRTLTGVYGLLFSHTKASYGTEAVGGLTMRRELEAGMRVDVFWPGTGPIVPEERLALKKLLSGGMDYWPNCNGESPETENCAFYFGSGGGLAVADFLADDDIDPCLNRLEGTLCVGGHIVDLDVTSWGMFTQRMPCNMFEIIAKFTKLSQLKNSGAGPSFALRCAPNEQAPVPCSFWNLKELAQIMWSFEPKGQGVEAFANPTPFHFEACPGDIGLMPNLLAVSFNAPGATGNLPSRLLQSPKLEVVTVENMPLDSLPVLDAVPNLREISLINNDMSGPFPSLANKQGLRKVVIQRNLLRNAAGQGATASSFDNCSNLETIVVTGTDITELFDFVNTTKLVSIDLSENRIADVIPATWTKLTAATTLDLSYNHITKINTIFDFANVQYDKPAPLRAMTSLKSLDM
jgi:hypothetical protein